MFYNGAGLFFAAVCASYYALQCEGKDGSGGYVSAVVGYKAQRYLGTAAFGFYLNVDHYAQMASYLVNNATAPDKRPDIIVFPEGGLQGENELYPIAVPSPEDFIVPCGDTSRYDMGLRSLSCLAQSLSTYLAVNLAESHLNATRNATQLFNTVVVFNRQGAVVARYRKSNANGAGFDSPGGGQQLATFVADFGVTFGLLLGNDLAFKEPGHTLTRGLKIKHFLNPTRRQSTLPYFTGVEVGHGWSWRTDSVLLSAGYTDPPLGYSGSGIYRGEDAPLEYAQPESDQPYALVARVDYTSPTLSAGNNTNVNTKRGVGRGRIPLGEVVRPGNEHAEMTMERMEEKIWSRHSQAKGRASSSVRARGLSRFLPARGVPPVDVYATRLIVPSVDESKLNGTSPPATVTGTASLERTVCAGRFCCSFQGQLLVTYTLFNQTASAREGSGSSSDRAADDYSAYFYRLAAFDGQRTEPLTGGGGVGGVLLGHQSCGIVPCLDATLSSCALRADRPGYPPATRTIGGALYTQTEALFASLSVSAVVPRRETFAYPTVLVAARREGDYGGLPEDRDAFRFAVSNLTAATQTVTLSARRVVAGLIEAGVQCRLYERDQASGQPTNAPHSPLTHLALLLLPLLLLSYHPPTSS